MKSLFFVITAFIINASFISVKAQCNPPCGPLWTAVNNTPISGEITMYYSCLDPNIKEFAIVANSSITYGGCQCSNTCCCPTGLVGYNLGQIGGSYDPNGTGIVTYDYPPNASCPNGVRLTIDRNLRTITFDCL